MSGAMRQDGSRPIVDELEPWLRAKLRLNRAAKLAEAAVEETLTYYAFSEEHWRSIRTNNPLERILRDPAADPHGRCIP
jgi:putative transposase